MGRVKGTHIKRMAKQIFGRFPGEFPGTFSANKKKLRSMGLVMTSKIELNKLVGEVTALVKRAVKRQKSEEATA